MTEKKYRITHNPYKKTTKIEEYYPGASNPWKALGSEKEPALNNILVRRESIQQICFELLNWLEGYNNRFSNCKPYEVIFNGIKQDYFEIETIGNVYVAQNKGCKFTHFVQPEKFWDSSLEIQQALEKICDNVKFIYMDEKELLQKIEKCIDVIDQNLNILILGMQNSGKSTLINALLGREILPTSDGVETAALYTIESGDADKVIIYLDDSQQMEIMISNKEINYHSIGNELDRIVSNISQSDTIKSAKDSSVIIRTILRELNVVCRNMQDDRGILFLKEVKIQLKDFKILGYERPVCIKDFPGAGAQYLGEEHKAIVREEIETITNAVTINVINADNSTYKNVYDFISDIKNIDELKEGDIGSQIDFARSIYVLNKAEGIKNWEEKEASVRKDLPNKKVVFCCAEAGVQITARGKKAILRKDPYGSDDADNVLNLQEHALLPDEYSKTDISLEKIASSANNVMDKASSEKKNQAEGTVKKTLDQIPKEAHISGDRHYVFAEDKDKGRELCLENVDDGDKLISQIENLAFKHQLYRVSENYSAMYPFECEKDDAGTERNSYVIKRTSTDAQMAGLILKRIVFSKDELQYDNKLIEIIPKKSVKTVVFCEVEKTAYEVFFYSLLEDGKWIQSNELVDQEQISEDSLAEAINQLVDEIRLSEHYSLEMRNIISGNLSEKTTWDLEQVEKTIGLYKIKKEWKAKYIK